MSKTYQETSQGGVTFAEALDPDNTLFFKVVRSYVPGTTVRFNKLLVSSKRYKYVQMNGCDDACQTTRSSELFNLRINAPAPTTESGVTELTAQWTAFKADVDKAIAEFNLLSGSTPPFSAVFNGA